MSWPTDGEPRFVLISVGGGDILPDSEARRGTTAIEYSILDRARCHRPVYVATCGVLRFAPRRMVHARALAVERCAELNAL